MHRSRFNYCLAFLLVSTVVFAQRNTSQEGRLEKGREFLGLAPPADPKAAARGQKLFVQTCGSCHGANATGAEGPDLVRSNVVLHDEHGELIGQVVSQGRPDRGMPPFANMTADQVHDLAEFLHSRVEAAANRYGYRILNVVTGDPKAGKVFFDSNCASCHSSTGDLAHIAAKFQPEDLQAQFLYPFRDAPAPQVAIRLPSGAKVSGRLKRLDDFNISIWTSSGEYSSWARDSVNFEIVDPLRRHRDLLGKYTNPDMHNVLAYLETLK